MDQRAPRNRTSCGAPLPSQTATYGDVFKQSISQAISWRLRYYAAIPPEQAAEDVLNFMDACFAKASEKQMTELAKVVEKAADAGVPEAMVAVGDY